MNPFDLKTALMAKHAQHVVLVHFPIALFLAGAAFDVAARWGKMAGQRLMLAAAARLNMLVAAAFAVPTLISGLLAWQLLFEGKKLKGWLLLHLTLGSVAVVLIFVIGCMHLRWRKRLMLPRFWVALEVVTAGVVVLTAHAGGFLSGVNITQ